MYCPLRGKTALITGGSRGIGRAIALALASHGGPIVSGYVKNEARASELGLRNGYCAESARF